MSNELPGHIAIEIYEWKVGKPRPGSEGKIRNDSLDVMQVPTGQPIPEKGDVLQLRMPNDPDADNLGFVEYVVLEREHVAWRLPKKGGPIGEEDLSNPLILKKMWIHVRRFKDYSLPVAEQ